MQINIIGRSPILKISRKSSHPLYTSLPKTKESSVRLWVLSTKLPRVNTQHFINSSVIGSTPWGAIESDGVMLQSMGVLH